MAKCLICLDHGALAVSRDNPDDIVTLHNKLASELEGRVFRVCECRKKSLSEKWRDDANETKSKKEYQGNKQGSTQKTSGNSKSYAQQLKGKP